MAKTKKGPAFSLSRPVRGKPASAEPAAPVPAREEPWARVSSDKSRVKMAGLKSTLARQNGEAEELWLVSQPGGNRLTVDRKITGDRVETVEGDGRLGVRIDRRLPNDVIVTGSRGGVTCDSVIPSPFRVATPEFPVGMDQRRLKDALEMRYFGQTYADNLHIQMIYAILDIEKSLTVHVNNVVYQLGNVCGGRKDFRDAVDCMSVQKSYENFIGKESSARVNAFNAMKNDDHLLYFGDLFARLGKKKVTDKNGKEKQVQTVIFRSDAEIYRILATLGTLRQNVVHAREGKRDSIYRLNEKGDRLAFLEEAYCGRTREIDDNFTELQSRENLPLLFSMYRISPKTESPDPQTLLLVTELTREFYDLVIRKGSKNMGFSVKKLREEYLKLRAASDPAWMALVNDNKYFSIRSKVNQMLDFALCRHFSAPENADAKERLIERLRAMPDEEWKDRVYAETAGSLPWLDEPAGKVRARAAEIISRSDNKKGKGKQEKYPNELSSALKQTVREAVNSYEKRVSAETPCNFVLLMELLCCFLDGKEINDLLTSLINKFECIGEFHRMNGDGRFGEIRFTKDHAIFDRENAGRTAGQLRILNSIARMKKPLEGPQARAALFSDALVVTGLADTYQPTELASVRVIKKGGPGADSPENLKNIGTQQVRNFILNNVINNKRFVYLVRYADPAVLKSIISSREVVTKILSEIPDTQVERYYLSCVSDDHIPPKKEAVRKLAEALSSFTLDDGAIRERRRLNDLEKQTTRDEKNNLIPRRSYAEKKEARQKQTAADNAVQLTRALLSLYLTVCYQAVKNLVYVNSRYTLAFHCLERDFPLSGCGSFPHDPRVGDWRLLSKNYINGLAVPDPPRPAPGADKHACRVQHRAYEKAREKNRVYRNLDSDYDKSNMRLISAFRNNVAHLNVIRKLGKYLDRDPRVRCGSWFGLYHYMMQQLLLDKLDEFSPEDREAVAAAAGEMRAARSSGAYCKDLVKELCIPFAYNYPRFKALTIEGLFDKNQKEEQKKEPDAQ